MQTLRENTTLQSGKYRIIKVLGQGGFGITYLAEQVMLGRKVAIKEFFYKECCDREDGTSHVTLGTQSNRETVQRFMNKFLKEARTISQLDHPNIIKIHDIFEENNTAYYVMEYIEGENLSELVKRQGALPEATAVAYIKKVADALAYIHARSINHLDVKPGNIMLRQHDQQIVLIDFGLSKQYDEVGSQTSSTPVGISQGFAPIEQYRAGGVAQFTPQTDIYSLGATLYWLVIGKTPPPADEILDDGLPSMPSHISASVKNAIESAMQAKKKDRPQSVEEFLIMIKLNHDSRAFIDREDEVTAVIKTAEGLSENTSKPKKRPYPYLSEISFRKACWFVAIFIGCGLIPVVIPVVLAFFAQCKGEKDVVKEEYSIEGIAKTLSEKKCRINHFVRFSGYESSFFSENLLCVSSNKKYGYMNKYGKIVIPCKYEDAGAFSEGLAPVEQGGKWGFIDKSGNVKIPFIYEWCSSFSNGLAMVEKKEHRVGFINHDGTVVFPFNYTSIFDSSSKSETSLCVSVFSEDMASVHKSHNGKFGFINKSGSIVIPCKYENAGVFSEGLASVKVGEKWGFIDKKGREVLPCIYEERVSYIWDKPPFFSEGLASVKVGGKWGFIDKGGKVTIPYKYEDAGAFSEGLAPVEQGGKWGFIDKSGNVKIPFIYEWCSSFSEGLAFVKYEGKMLGVIDKNGKCTYDYYQRDDEVVRSKNYGGN